jgi:hypothetical protein
MAFAPSGVSRLLAFRAFWHLAPSGISRLLVPRAFWHLARSGKERQLGSIAPGKLAELVVISGNPLGTPRGIYDVVTVFKGGLGYDSARLRDAAKGQIGGS